MSAWQHVCYVNTKIKPFGQTPTPMTVSWLDIELDIGIECHGYVIYILLLQYKTS